MGYIRALRWQSEQAVDQKAFDLRQPLRIGRRFDNEIQLLDDRVSRTHAELQWLDGALQITNLSRTNQIWVISQGHRVILTEGQTLILKPTDHFLIGGTLFEILADDKEWQIICPECGRILPARLIDCPFDGTILANGHSYKG